MRIAVYCRLFEARNAAGSRARIVRAEQYCAFPLDRLKRRLHQIHHCVNSVQELMNSNGQYLKMIFYQ